MPSPKVVLASTADMECGFSRDLFAQWCVNGKNTIILTSRSAGMNVFYYSETFVMKFKYSRDPIKRAARLTIFQVFSFQSRLIEPARLTIFRKYSALRA